MPVAPIRARAKVSKNRGRGKVQPTKDVALVDNAPRNEAPPLHHDKIEEDVNVQNEGDVEQDEEVHAETTCFHPLDTVLAQQIMSFLKGLASPGLLPYAQVAQDFAIGLLVTLPQDGLKWRYRKFPSSFVGSYYEW